MKPRNILLIISALLIVAVLIAGFFFRKGLKRIFNRVISRGYVFYNDDSCKGCAILFQDGISVHQSAYYNDGITPKNDFDDLQNLIDNGTLVEISSCERYTVEPMNASLPCLLPKGVAFIERLSGEYKELCVQNKLVYIPFRITSATRTRKSIKALMKNNGNAIENSVHLKGKTLDISYIFNKEHAEQKELFIKALSNMKDDGLCYVKYEVNMKCLHITCR